MPCDKMTIKSELDLFTPQTNLKGISVTVSSRVTPELNELVERLVEMNGSPWDSKSAFVCEAIFHYAKEVETMNDFENSVPQIIRLIDEWKRKNFDVTVMRQLSESVAQAVNELVYYHKEGGTDKLSSRMDEVCDLISSINDYFWLIRTCMAFFGHKAIIDCIEWLDKQDRLGNKTRQVYESWLALNNGQDNT